MLAPDADRFIKAGQRFGMAQVVIDSNDGGSYAKSPSSGVLFQIVRIKPLGSFAKQLISRLKRSRRATQWNPDNRKWTA